MGRDVAAMHIHRHNFDGRINHGDGTWGVGVRKVDPAVKQLGGVSFPARDSKCSDACAPGPPPASASQLSLSTTVVLEYLEGEGVIRFMLAKSVPSVF